MRVYAVTDDQHPGIEARFTAADAAGAQEQYIEQMEEAGEVHGNLTVNAIPRGWDKVEA